MTSVNVDVLMVTYNRPHYTAVSLRHLLDSADEHTRVWLWHNGDDERTLAVVDQQSSRLHRFHHSKENVGLTAPTNWLLQNATGDFLGKVDDDCIVALDWIPRLVRAHLDAPMLGVVGCWHFQPEDYDPELAAPKMRNLPGGHRVLENMWVGGSGYLMKRECVERLGLLKSTDTFSGYCIRIARAGWTNGWLFPFVYQDHMDDPRSSRSGIKSDADLAKCLPLSAQRNGVQSVDEWAAQLRRSATLVQKASVDRDYWSPRRQRLRRIGATLKRFATGSRRKW